MDGNNPTSNNVKLSVQIVIRQSLNEPAELSQSCTTSISIIQYQTLLTESDFFKTLDDTYHPIDSEEPLILVEDNPFEAMSFLRLICCAQHAELVSWNKSYALLSSKWLIPKYISCYANIAMNFLTKLSKCKSVTITCAQSPSVNGVYELLDRNKYAYFKKGDGRKLYLSADNRDGKYTWTIQGYLTIYTCDVTSSSFSDIPSVEKWIYNSSYIYNVIIAKNPHFANVSKLDQSLFCEIVEIFLSCDAYRRPPLTNKSDLIDILLLNKEVQVDEILDRLLTQDEKRIFRKSLMYSETITNLTNGNK
jgi:hypothetical protein